MRAAPEGEAAGAKTRRRRPKAGQRRFEDGAACRFPSPRRRGSGARRRGGDRFLYLFQKFFHPVQKARQKPRLLTYQTFEGDQRLAVDGGVNIPPFDLPNLLLYILLFRLTIAILFIGTRPLQRVGNDGQIVHDQAAKGKSTHDNQVLQHSVAGRDRLIAQSNIKQQNSKIKAMMLTKNNFALFDIFIPS